MTGDSWVNLIRISQYTLLFWWYCSLCTVRWLDFSASYKIFYLCSAAKSFNPFSLLFASHFIQFGSKAPISWQGKTLIEATTCSRSFKQHLALVTASSCKLNFSIATTAFSGCSRVVHANAIYSTMPPLLQSAVLSAVQQNSITVFSLLSYIHVPLPIILLLRTACTTGDWASSSSTHTFVPSTRRDQHNYLLRLWATAASLVGCSWHV